MVSTGQGVLGYNMFAYCGNNPISNYDSIGLFWKKVGNFFKKTTTAIYNGVKKIAIATAKSFVAEIGFGPGIGASSKLGSYEVAATAYHDHITLGVKEGKSYTSIKGEANISVMAADDIGVGFSTEYEHLYEDSGVKLSDIHTTESSPWSVYKCKKTTRDWQILILNNNMVDGEEMDLYFGLENELHIGYGGHYMIGWDVVTFFESLLE